MITKKAAGANSKQNKFTENWICSKYQTHKCRATAITENNELIETRGEHNHDISAGTSEDRNVIKHIKDLSERFIPTVAVASAVLPITNDLATQFALPTAGLKKFCKLLFSPSKKHSPKHIYRVVFFISPREKLMNWV